MNGLKKVLVGAGLALLLLGSHEVAHASLTDGNGSWCAVKYPRDQWEVVVFGPSKASADARCNSLHSVSWGWTRHMVSGRYRIYGTMVGQPAQVIVSGYGLPGKPIQWTVDLPYADAHHLQQVCSVKLPGGYTQWVLNGNNTAGQHGAAMGLCYKMSGRYYSEA